MILYLTRIYPTHNNDFKNNLLQVKFNMTYLNIHTRLRVTLNLGIIFTLENFLKTILF